MYKNIAKAIVLVAYTSLTWYALRGMGIALATIETIFIVGLCGVAALDKKFALEGEGDTPGTLVMMSLLAVFSPFAAIVFPDVLAYLAKGYLDISLEVRHHNTWMDWMAAGITSTALVAYVWMPFGCYALINRGLDFLSKGKEPKVAL